MANLEEIIHEAKLLADRIKLALFVQNNLSRDGFDITDLEFSKPLQHLQEKLVSSEKKFKSTQDQLAQAKQMVSDVTEKYNSSLDENVSIKTKHNELLTFSEFLQSDQLKTEQDTKNKLKTYKSLSGIRFEFNPLEEVLNGYIALSGKSPSESVFVPFELNKNACDNPNLWEKINQACDCNLHVAVIKSINICPFPFKRPKISV